MVEPVLTINASSPGWIKLAAVRSQPKVPEPDKINGWPSLARKTSLVLLIASLKHSIKWGSTWLVPLWDIALRISYNF